MWSGVLTVTASMLLPISSSILRKSVNFFAFGKLLRPPCPSVLSSMSQMATTSPCRPASAESLDPLPPTPMQAKADPLVGQATGTGRNSARGPIAGAGGGGGLDKSTAVLFVGHGGELLAKVGMGTAAR